MLDARGVSREEHDRLRARPDLQSVGAAVQLFCTAAHALGYGACWMTAPVLAAPAIEKLLGAEPRARLAALVPVGRPAGAASPPRASRLRTCSSSADGRLRAAAAREPIRAG